MAVQIPDLAGKTILVTGGNSGIGEAIVRALADHNPSIIYIAARRIDSSEEVAKSIRSSHPNGPKIEVLELDLSTFASVKKCAAEFNARSERLDLLFLHAGISAVNPKLTADGYEMQFGVNHMGHALFTQLLMPTLLKTKRSEPSSDVRILVTASTVAANKTQGDPLDVTQMKNADAYGSSLKRYDISKLANVLFARRLAQEYPEITTVSNHPGVVMTPIWGKADGVKLLVTFVKPLVWLFGRNATKGAEVALWTSVAKVGEGKGEMINGAYYEDMVKPRTDPPKLVDQALTDKLWDWTNEELAAHGGPGWPKKE